eukprot:TRINITY_DN3279_c0_g1_i2.p1 TRINITY_DN3279_c0_g1~~TRINITY_DN3279_c0_g1_i2.p1  ORF type:complete len:488 (-),score=79.10 TRINITY_DN3279_c0_g1_i2:68-1531(-)
MSESKVSETKSERVKSLDFHPTRPLLLAGIFSGEIQLWDYTSPDMPDLKLVHTYNHNTLPVRAVAFHKREPVFASGCDDFTVKIWDYETHSEVRTLLGHLDYIRSVMFHPNGTDPLLLTASDDQLARLWNYKTGECIATFSGLCHYVMRAVFSPITNNMIVTGSLDMTVSVWTYEGYTAQEDTPLLQASNMSSSSSSSSLSLSSSRQSSPCKVNRVHVVDDHLRGVNWVSCHPTQSIIASAGDDNQVMLWRLNDAHTKPSLVASLQGHTTNVSFVEFYPHSDLIISGGEDGRLILWDTTQSSAITYTSLNNRYWAISCHLHHTLIAAGHDGGFDLINVAHPSLHHLKDNTASPRHYNDDNSDRHNVIDIDDGTSHPDTAPILSSSWGQRDPTPVLLQNEIVCIDREDVPPPALRPGFGEYMMSRPELSTPYMKWHTLVTTPIKTLMAFVLIVWEFVLMVNPARITLSYYIFVALLNALLLDIFLHRV